MNESKSEKVLKARLDKVGVANTERHMFLCLGPKCCEPELGDKVWQYLKSRLAELNLTPQKIFRSKVGCLRVCQQGPVALVYPEGIWYKEVDIEACERIIQEHLIEGRPVKDKIIAKRPLLT